MTSKRLGTNVSLFLKPFFSQILSRFYPEFLEIGKKQHFKYLNFILILSRFFRNLPYSNFIGKKFDKIRIKGHRRHFCKLHSKTNPLLHFIS